MHGDGDPMVGEGDRLAAHRGVSPHVETVDNVTEGVVQEDRGRAVRQLLSGWGVAHGGADDDSLSLRAS
jgi:hypothetical protein